MSGMALVVGLCAVALVFSLAAWRFRPGRSRLRPAGRAALGAPSGVSLYGLAPRDAERLRHSAREAMQREQAQWGRDYLPGMSDGAIPGRIAGIPRTLRVRR